MAYMFHLQIGHGSVVIEANDDGLAAIESAVRTARAEGSGALTSSRDDPNGISAILIKRTAA